MSDAKAIQMKTERCSGPVAWGMAIVRKTRPIGLLSRILLIGCLAIAVSGIGHVLANPAREESREIADLVAVLTEESHRTSSVPGGISSSLGYEPVATKGTLAKPTGGCSTPIPLGPGIFEEACRVHDLGYDLLRSADESGNRLGAWARFELDRRLYLDLLTTCETVSCRTSAATYYTAVTTNSIRQGYGVPTDEPATPWVGVGLLVVCFALLSDPRSGLRALAQQVSREAFPITRARHAMEPFHEPGSDAKRTTRRKLTRTLVKARIGTRTQILRHRRYGRSTV